MYLLRLRAIATMYGQHGQLKRRQHVEMIDMNIENVQSVGIMRRRYYLQREIIYGAFIILINLLAQRQESNIIVA